MMLETDVGDHLDHGAATLRHTTADSKLNTTWKQILVTQCCTYTCRFA